MFYPSSQIMAPNLMKIGRDTPSNLELKIEDWHARDKRLMWLHVGRFELVARIFIFLFLAFNYKINASKFTQT